MPLYSCQIFGQERAAAIFPPAEDATLDGVFAGVETPHISRCAGSINNLLTGPPPRLSRVSCAFGSGARCLGRTAGRRGGSQGGAAAGGTPSALKQVGIHASSSVCVCEAVAVTLADIHKFVTCTRENFVSPPVGLLPVQPLTSEVMRSKPSKLFRLRKLDLHHSETRHVHRCCCLSSLHLL